MKVKLSSDPALGETFSVRIAAVDSPTAKTAFSLFQDSVKLAFAFAGVQELVVMVRVSGTVPVLLM